MLRVGLTGGIACGKSHVLRRLAAQGMGTLDLDTVAHALMAPGGAAYADVASAFGPAILAPDATIDRAALGKRVFSDEASRRRLEALVHPRVRDEEDRQARALAAEGCPVLVSDAALLVEAGGHLRYDRLVVVHCPPEEQLARLMRRDGIGREQALARIGAQMPIEEKRRYAHVAISTAGTVAQTEAAADALRVELGAVAGVPPLQVVGLAERALGALVHGAGPGPRGLDPVALATAGKDDGRLELARLSRRLQPPAVGPWYQAARPGEGAPWPEVLAPVLALWALGRGLDEDWLVSAAASLARLTHREEESVAGACLAALLAFEIGRGRSLEELAASWGELAPRARHWAGAEAPRRVVAALEAAAGHPRAAGEARRAAAEAGADPALAGALVGLGGGDPAGGDDDLRSLAAQLAAPA